MKQYARQSRSKWWSLSNIIYAALTLTALILFMHDAQASGSIPAFLLNL